MEYISVAKMAENKDVLNEVCGNTTPTAEFVTPSLPAKLDSFRRMHRRRSVQIRKTMLLRCFRSCVSRKLLK